MAHRRRHHPLLLSLAVLGALLLVPTGASAAATCDWRDMIDAAANNRQINTHSTACYEHALSEVPSDTDDYLPEVRANLIFAMRRDAQVKAETTGGTLSRELAGSNTPVASASVRGPVTSLLEGLGPAHVDEVPLPVVALGGLASLLLLAGLGTSLARMRARRAARLSR